VIGRICPQCGGDLIVYTSRVQGDYRHRYLHCIECGFLPPGKEIVPIAYAPQRRKPLNRRLPIKRLKIRRRD
jgi:ssDNA-binding Zn-finger/Zn-ribbon topoisomerase 1